MPTKLMTKLESPISWCGGVLSLIVEERALPKGPAGLGQHVQRMCRRLALSIRSRQEQEQKMKLGKRKLIDTGKLSYDTGLNTLGKTSGDDN